MLNSPLGRSFLSGLAGFFAYGGWAVFANYEHGMEVAMRAGLAQGTFSLVITFVMTIFTEWVYIRVGDVPGKLYTITGMISLTLFASAYSIHLFIGTPEILMTILPGFVIGTLYTFAYVMGLQKHA